MVEWLEHCAYDQHGLDSKPTCAILLSPWERHFLQHTPLLGVLGKQFELTVISLLNYKPTAIFWHLQKQVRVIAYPMY